MRSWIILTLLCLSVPAFAETPICGSGPRVTCVVDGDTIWWRGEKIRILDIDTPETDHAECLAERMLGELATERLAELLDGEIRIERERNDRYGRTLARVFVDGQNASLILIEEGYALEWRGSQWDWCDED